MYIGIANAIGTSKIVDQLWTPANGAFDAWWDASDTGTITDGSGRASAIADKINSYDMTQGTTVEQPWTGSRTQNSLNVLDFRGAEIMTNAGIGAALSGNDVPYSFAFFGSTDTTVASGNFFGLGNAGAGQAFSAHNANVGVPGYSLARRDDAGANGVADAGSGLTTDHGGFLCRFDGQSANWNINGLTYPTSTVNVGVATFDVGCIGNVLVSGSPIAYWDGAWGELVLKFGFFTDAEVDLLQGYGAWKWGTVASLDASNPYKSTPPTV